MTSQKRKNMKKTHLFQAKHYCVPSKIGVFESCPEQPPALFPGFRSQWLEAKAAANWAHSPLPKSG
jgi:hypothetical protein